MTPDPFQKAVQEFSAKSPAPGHADLSMGEPVDLRAIGRMLTTATDLMLRDLLAWRAALTSATSVQPEDMVFLVPETALPGVTEAFGSQVIHSPEVRRPMVAVGVPKIG